jgi:hypothetical protein
MDAKSAQQIVMKSWIQSYLQGLIWH